MASNASACHDVIMSIAVRVYQTLFANHFIVFFVVVLDSAGWSFFKVCCKSYKREVLKRNQGLEFSHIKTKLHERVKL